MNRSAHCQPITVSFFWCGSVPLQAGIAILDKTNQRNSRCLSNSWLLTSPCQLGHRPHMDYWAHGSLKNINKKQLVNKKVNKRSQCCSAITEKTILPSGHLQVAECETVSQMAFAPHSLNPMQGSVQLPFIQAVPIVQSLLKWQPGSHLPRVLLDESIWQTWPNGQFVSRRQPGKKIQWNWMIFFIVNCVAVVIFCSDI